MTVHKYRVRVGRTYGASDQWKEGDIVELDDSVAQHAMDKLELAEIVQPTEVISPPPSEELSPTDEQLAATMAGEDSAPEEEEIEEVAAPVRKHKGRSTRKSGDD